MGRFTPVFGCVLILFCFTCGALSQSRFDVVSVHANPTQKRSDTGQYGDQPRRHHLHRSELAIMTYALDQLGLKLESERAMVEMIIVDHAEKPDAN